jgi:SAM-dependent methyltransferase
MISPKGLYRRVLRAWSVLKESGVREFLARTTNKVRQSAGREAFLRRKQAVDEAYDRTTGVDTGGVEHLYDLTITSKNARFGTSHIASDPGEFAEAMASVDIDLSTATFVDMGSGKGRALLLACEFPFVQIIGVEFATELHVQAEANIKAVAAKDRGDPRIMLVHGDATLFDLPETALILYFFNPFDAEVMRVIAEAAHSSWRANPRAIRIVYVNPLHSQIWLDAGWQVLARGHAHAIFGPWEPLSPHR